MNSECEYKSFCMSSVTARGNDALPPYVVNLQVAFQAALYEKEIVLIDLSFGTIAAIPNVYSHSRGKSTPASPGIHNLHRRVGPAVASLEVGTDVVGVPPHFRTESSGD